MKLDPAIVAWVSANVIPFEAELRQKLRRRCASAEEVDDLIQDVYYRILKMVSLDHVRDPRAFLMQTAKHILIDRARHAAIVQIDSCADVEELGVADGAPSPERVVLGRLELRRVLGMVARLPSRCRQVFEARRIDGWSQEETATRLGLSSNVVEKEVMKGVKLVLQMVAEAQAHGCAVPDAPGGRVRVLPKPAA